MKVSEIKIGETYNGVKVLEDLGRIRPSSSAYYFLCVCPICRGAFEIRASHIGETQRCSKCKGVHRRRDITGQRFGRLVAIEYYGSVNKRTLWKCRCDCGKTIITGEHGLCGGQTKSCGCLAREKARDNRIKFGSLSRTVASVSFMGGKPLATHPLWGIWYTMIQRCCIKTFSAYKRYGGRGIKVCERWQPQNKGFENFVIDMGERPTLNHSLDRIDVNGDYTPENCRWATQRLQANNRRNNNILIYKEQEITVSVLSEMLGINKSTLYNGLRNGVDINILIANQLRIKKGQKRLSHKFCRNYNKHISLELDEYTEIKPKQILGFAPKKEYVNKFNNQPKPTTNNEF